MDTHPESLTSGVGLSHPVRDVLIVCMRFPTPGKAKTRLIPALGAAGATRLQREMTRHTLAIVRELRPDIAMEVQCDGGDTASVQRMFGHDLAVREQVEGDLGERMLSAFRSAFERGYRRMVLIGTDCPSITPSILRQAFDRLTTHDCVFGPALDGGYYLIGLKQPRASMFHGITWGGSRVLAKTLAQAQEAGLATAFLERLPDIDRLEDIPLWEEVMQQGSSLISVVIPALNEEGVIAETLAPLEHGSNIEILVMDGGSRDRTVAVAAAHGARVISAGPGRAAQMNAGARYATGDILLFLHADSRLPAGFDQDIRTALADPRTVAGAFSLGFDKDNFALKIMEYGANLRSRCLQLPYGDQGIFLWKADFQTSGGYPELPIMEDAALIWALREEGRIVTLASRAVTSARRYEKLGPFSTWIINQCVIIGFLKGVDPAELARLYRSHTGIAGWLKVVGDAIRQKQVKKPGK